MKTKKMTRTLITKRVYADNKIIIMKQMDMDEQIYNQQVYDTAVAWIKHHVWNDDEMVRCLTEQKEFWTWWLNQWNIRDAEFVYEFVQYLVSEQDFSQYLRDMWNFTHRADRINITLQPAWSDEQYGRIINKAFKKLQGLMTGSAQDNKIESA
jgi:hypothetical protein